MVYFSGLLCMRSLMSFVNLIRPRRFFVITANHYSVGHLNEQQQSNQHTRFIQWKWCSEIITNVNRKINEKWRDTTNNTKHERKLNKIRQKKIIKLYHDAKWSHWYGPSENVQLKKRNKLCNNTNFSSISFFLWISFFGRYRCYFLCLVKLRQCVSAAAVVAVDGARLHYGSSRIWNNVE